MLDPQPLFTQTDPYQNGMIRNTGFICLFVSQDNETDTDNEEIKQRDVAIAEAELAAAHLQREIRETEQAELTDTGTRFLLRCS